jgi:hypothetical protein
MSNELDPVIGNWYRDTDKEQAFRVVEIDDDESTVTIQHFDGDLEQIEAAAWLDMDLEPAEPPEDWTGPLDEVINDDLGLTDTGIQAESWVAPVEGSARGKEEWEDDEDDDELEEWDDVASGEDLHDLDR